MALKVEGLVRSCRACTASPLPRFNGWNKLLQSGFYQPGRGKRRVMGCRRKLSDDQIDNRNSFPSLAYQLRSWRREPTSVHGNQGKLANGRGRTVTLRVT